MANDKKQPRADLTSNSLVLAVLVAASTYFIVRGAPLQGERPAVTEPQFHEKVGKQDIEARLWQDPFTAVAKSLDKLVLTKADEPCKQKPDHRHCRSPLAGIDEKTLENPLVIGVTVSGAPYSEEVEFRRRLRYAVLAGLDRAGFVPKDSQHIGYFHPDRKEGLPLPIVVPVEWFEKSDPSQRILLLWLDEDVLGDKPLEQLFRLIYYLRQSSLIKPPAIRILGPETPIPFSTWRKRCRTAKIGHARLHPSGQKEAKLPRRKGRVRKSVGTLRG
jgi:hypothetical protein